MRRKYTIANWKMNLAKEQVDTFFNEFVASYSSSSGNSQTIICPPFPYLHAAVNACSNMAIDIGAQDVSAHVKGAYTGEVAAFMLQSIGATHAIVGHSERRQNFGETSEILRKKITHLLSCDITPIFCIGEPLDERKAGNHFAVVEEQLRRTMSGFYEAQLSKWIIAYEPVWAIGTGVTASTSQVQEMHLHIRKVLSVLYNNDVASSMPIIYGGSVKPSNSEELFLCPDVDGSLVGGASLDPHEFYAIMRANH